MVMHTDNKNSNVWDSAIKCQTNGNVPGTKNVCTSVLKLKKFLTSFHREERFKQDPFSQC